MLSNLILAAVLAPALCTPPADAVDTPGAAVGAVRAQIANLLPDLRTEADAVGRALDPPPTMACRRLMLLWRAGFQGTPAAPVDGSMVLLHQSACWGQFSIRAPASLDANRILVIATDRDGALLWWTQAHDPRYARPMPMPPGGSPSEDRESRRMHSLLVRVGAGTLDVDVPADRRIAHLTFYEARRREGAQGVVSLGHVDLPTS